MFLDKWLGKGEDRTPERKQTERKQTKQEKEKRDIARRLSLLQAEVDVLRRAAGQ